MFEEIIGNIMVCLIFVYIIYSTINMALQNKKLGEENKALKECIKQQLETFKDIYEGQEKVFKEVRETNKGLIERTKKLEG